MKAYLKYKQEETTTLESVTSPTPITLVLSPLLILKCNLATTIHDSFFGSTYSAIQSTRTALVITNTCFTNCKLGIMMLLGSLKAEDIVVEGGNQAIALNEASLSLTRGLISGIPSFGYILYSSYSPSFRLIDSQFLHNVASNFSTIISVKSPTNMEVRLSIHQ